MHRLTTLNSLLMKLLTTILTLILATASALASIDPQDLTVQRDVTNGTVIFRSTIALPAATEVAIEDGYGNVIYTDSVGGGNFLNKRFPVSSFSANSYKLILSDEIGRTTIPLRFEDENGVVDTERVHQVIYPSIDLRAERTLVVDYQNKSGRRVDIKIANHEGETVFTDSVNGNDVSRAYRLDRLHAGDYQVIVSSRDVKRHTMAFALE